MLYPLHRLLYLLVLLYASIRCQSLDGKRLNALCQKERSEVEAVKNNLETTDEGNNDSIRQAYYMLAYCYHINEERDVAMSLYLDIRKKFPNFAYCLVNLALIQMPQNLSLTIESLERYFSDVGGVYGNQTVIVDKDAVLFGPPCIYGSSFAQDCVTALNFYGNAKWKLFEYNDAEQAYRRAIEIGGTNFLIMSDVYINLGELLLITNHPLEADRALRNASEVNKLYGKNDLSSDFHRILTVPSIPSSIEEVVKMENKILHNIESFSLENRHNCSIVFSRIPSVHFYFHYYGFNDFKVHSKVSDVVRNCLPKAKKKMYSLPTIVDPSLSPLSTSLLDTNNLKQKARIVFVSCLLHGDEPHGQLIQNVVQSISRSVLEIIIVNVSSKSLNQDMMAAVDEFYNTPNNLISVRILLDSLRPDCLVFVESVNAGVMYFLAHERFAPVQVMLMGAPVTSGIRNSIDYFISADRLEHPFRTQFPCTGEHNCDPYTEQVVLFDGQGISFPKTERHSEHQSSSLAAGDASFTRTAFESLTVEYVYDSFGLPVVNGSLYFSFQSLFKIQPIFDHIILILLHSDRNGHFILQASREKSKTQMIANRLITTARKEFCRNEDEDFLCKEAKDILSRIHFVPRKTTDELATFLKRATVILQPFPFDGSKTASDAIRAGVPIVTLPQKYLKGRLTTTFLHTMALHNFSEELSVYSCCIASSFEDYLSKALRLGTDHQYWNEISKAIMHQKDRIFDFEEITMEWTLFLVRSMGIPLTPELKQDIFSKVQNLQQLKDFNAEIILQQQKWWMKKKRNSFLQHM